LPVKLIIKHKTVPRSTVANYQEKFNYKYRYLTQVVDLFITGYTEILDNVFHSIVESFELPHTKLRLEKSQFTDTIKNYIKKKRLYFKLKWKKVFSPTGVKITESDWDSLGNSVEGFLKEAGKYLIQPAVSTVYVMGKLLSKIEAEGKVADNLSIDQIMGKETQRVLNTFTKEKPELTDPVEKRVLEYSIQNTGRYIKNLSADIVPGIQQRVNNAIINNLSSRQLATDLFNHFSDTNRDMRRIAAYELVSAHNNGHIVGVKEMNEQAGIDKTYMVLNNLPGACDFCQEWEGKPVLVLNEAPKGGSDYINDPSTDYAIWPGKNNVGRDHKEWWISVNAQHPHCNCYWTSWLP